MKRTKTYPGHVKPVRVGVYERRFPRGAWVYSFWGGELWRWHGVTPDEAASLSNLYSGEQSLPWRGLAKDHSKDQA